MVGGVGQREQRRLGVYSNIARRSVSYTAVSTLEVNTLGAWLWPPQSVDEILTPSAISILDCTNALAVEKMHNDTHNPYDILISLRGPYCWGTG